MTKKFFIILLMMGLALPQAQSFAQDGQLAGETDLPEPPPADDDDFDFDDLPDLPPIPDVDGPVMGDTGAMIDVLEMIHMPPIPPVHASSGIAIGKGYADPIMKFGFSVAHLDNGIGQAELLKFDAIVRPGDESEGGSTWRVRFALADSQVLFLCHEQTEDENGEIQENFKAIPGMALLNPNCRPDEKFGLGIKLVQGQWDSEVDRWALRWAEVNFVLNILANGNRTAGQLVTNPDGTQSTTFNDPLHRQFQIFAGLSLDSVFKGSTPGIQDRNDEIYGRLNVGIAGFVRTNNDRFEARGIATLRPRIAFNEEFYQDIQAEAKLSALVNFLLGESTVLQAGVEGAVAYNSIPGLSMSDFASLHPDQQVTGSLMGVINVLWGN